MWQDYETTYLNVCNLLRRAWRRLIYQFAFGIFEHAGLHILPADYTSPVPDTRDLRNRRSEWYRPSEMPGIDLGIPAQLQLLQTLEVYRAEFPLLPEHDDLVRQGIGLGFGDVEAHMLYAMVRLFMPSTILEVGSGVSTCYSSLALRKNGSGSICCIEPYPLEPFRALAEREGVVLLRTPVQSLDLSIFENLKKDDILFIDSSHILKLV